MTNHKQEDKENEDLTLVEQLYQNRKRNGAEAIVNDVERNYQILNNTKKLDDKFETRVVNLNTETKTEEVEDNIKDEVIEKNFKNNTLSNLPTLEELQKNKNVAEKSNLGNKLEIQTGEIWSQIIQEKSEVKNVVQDNSPVEKEESFNQMYETVFGTSIKKEEQEENVETINPYEVMNDDNKVSIFEKEEFLAPNYKFIGIAFSTYIIIEMNNEIYIIDQHAAHERIMYEKVKENFYKDEEKNSQLLLLPDVITLTHKEMDIARENIDIFEKAGFELEEFGENTIKLTGVPEICYDLDTKELFLETLDEINTVALTAKQEKEDKFIATVACKAAVKANMALTEEEVKSLMDKLLKLPNPFTCPHGRPTAIKMEKTDIEKKFARRK